MSTIQASSLPSTGFVRLSVLANQSEVTAEQATANRAAGNSRPRKPRPPRIGVTGVGHVTLWRMVRDGKFPKPLKLGNSTVWRVEDVKAWIKAQGGDQ